MVRAQAAQVMPETGRSSRSGAAVFMRELRIRVHGRRSPALRASPARRRIPQLRWLTSSTVALVTPGVAASLRSTLRAQLPQVIPRTDKFSVSIRHTYMMLPCAILSQEDYMIFADAAGASSGGGGSGQCARLHGEPAGGRGPGSGRRLRHLRRARIRPSPTRSVSGSNGPVAEAESIGWRRSSAAAAPKCPSNSARSPNPDARDAGHRGYHVTEFNNVLVKRLAEPPSC